MAGAVTNGLRSRNGDIQVGRFRIILDRGGHDVSQDARREIESSVR
jgi:hypothetical protein